MAIDFRGVGFLYQLLIAKSVRVNMTMDDDVYERLKKEVPPPKLSAFISEAVRAKLHSAVKPLKAAYWAASKEQWRTSLADDWKHSRWRRMKRLRQTIGYVNRHYYPFLHAASHTP